MKKRYLIIACAIPIGIWLIVPFLVQYPKWVIYKLNPDCAKGLADASCAASFAALGQSGDIYGVASSLFSGLALFAVAATLWFDFSARRSSRKPLLVCTIDETKELSFDEPSHKRPRSVRFRAAVKVKAAHDTAMNISANLMFRAGNFNLDLGRLHVQVPLLSGDSEILEYGSLLRETEIKMFVDELNQGTKMFLDVSAQCNSIEELRWQTSVTYELSFHNSDIELIRKLTHDEAVLIEAWQGGAAVSLDYKIEADSWSHKEVTTDNRPPLGRKKISSFFSRN